MNILLDIPLDLLTRIEKVQESMKTDVPEKFVYTLSEEDRQQAHKLAKERGVAFANAYLKECSKEAKAAWRKRPEIQAAKSRRALIIQLIEAGLANMSGRA